MALNTTALASNLTTMMSEINADITPRTDSKTSYANDPAGKWVQQFATIYDDYATAGVSSTGTGFVMTSNPGPLSAWSPTNTGTSSIELGEALADYWASQITPGIPQYEGIITVSNNAGSLAGAYAAAIQACYTTSTVTPGYSTFVDAIHGVTSGIIWTITEKKSPGTITYPTTVV